MRLSYDPEGDILEVVFSEHLQRASKKAFQLRHGIVLYLAKESLQPVQLTLVHYRGLAEIPQFDCEAWRVLSTTDQEILKPILASEPVAAFLRLDPDTGYARIPSRAVPEVFALAA